VSDIQLMSRCAGDGKEHSQTASPSRPMQIFRTIDVMLSLHMGLASRQEAINSSCFHQFESPFVWEFELSWEFSKICVFQFL